MGAYAYCECGAAKKRPTALQLLYGRSCPYCKESETFSTAEKVDFLLQHFIEKEKNNDNNTAHAATEEPQQPA